MSLEDRHVTPTPEGISLDLVLAGASHGAITGLWVGPGPMQTVAVGLFASPSAVASLVACYEGVTTGILYPYPVRFSRGWADNNRVDFMLMTIRLDFLRSMGYRGLSTSAVPLLRCSARP